MEELLSKIQSEIDTLQAEVNAGNSSIADKRDKLKRMLSAKQALLGREKARGTRGTYQKSRETAVLIADLLAHGPLPMGKISEYTGMSRNSVLYCLSQSPRKHWFKMVGSHRNPNTVWELTEAGRNRQAA